MLFDISLYRTYTEPWSGIRSGAQAATPSRASDAHAQNRRQRISWPASRISIQLAIQEARWKCPPCWQTVTVVAHRQCAPRPPFLSLSSSVSNWMSWPWWLVLSKETAVIYDCQLLFCTSSFIVLTCYNTLIKILLTGTKKYLSNRITNIVHYEMSIHRSKSIAIIQYSLYFNQSINLLSF